MGSELVVALFDVLGFEDRIGRLSLDEVHDQYKDLLAIATSKVATPSSMLGPPGTVRWSHSSAS